MEMTARKPHVLVFPFPTQGHVRSVVDLAHSLADAGVLVTLVHTPANFIALGHRLHLPPHSHSNSNGAAAVYSNGAEAAAANNGNSTDNGSAVYSNGSGNSTSANFSNGNVASPRLQIVVLPLPPEIDQMLPCTAPLPIIFPTVDTALSEPLENLILQLNRREHQPPVSCIISDSFMPWTMDLAKKLGIQRVEMWTASVTAYLLGYHLPEFVDRGYVPCKPGDENYEREVDFVPGIDEKLVGAAEAGESRLPKTWEIIAKDVLSTEITDPLFQFLQRAFTRGREAFRVLVNSCEELEARTAAALRVEGVRVVPIGPLLEGGSCRSTKRSSSSSLRKEEETEEWLDAQEPGSVVYVAFGSAGMLTEAELREVAMALEESGRPYLWAIGCAQDLKKVQQEGFMVKMKSSKGKLASWVAQRQVLAHKAVGLFVSHCGWNSVLESIHAAVPIVGCPRMAEQNINLWMLSRVWRIGVAGCSDDMVISRERLGGAISGVMLQAAEDGRLNARLRRNVGRLSALVRENGLQGADNGSSNSSFHGFVNALHKVHANDF